MASSSKQLREHLQGQQEPFKLDIYLSERGMMFKNKTQRTTTCNLNKRSIFSISTKKILKLVLYKFFPPKHSHRDFSHHLAQKQGLASKRNKKIQQIGATRRYFAMGSSVACSNSSKCCMKDSPRHENQVSLARTSQTNKQSNTVKQEVATNTGDEKRPISRSLQSEATISNTGCQLQGEREKEDDASTLSTTITECPEEDSILSSFLWELLVKTLLEKNQAGLKDVQEMTGLAFSKLLKNMRAFQQTKQLLFDCIKEAIEVNGKKSRYHKYTQELMSLQELAKIIYKQIWSWGNQDSVQRTNFDVATIVEVWDDMQQLNKKIGLEVEDAIMDDIIQEVIGLLFQ